MNKLTAFILCIMLGANAFAQETESEPDISQGPRLVNEQSATLTDRGKLLLFVQHRFGEIDGGFYQLFGLDQATMRLGFEYGLGENLNVGIGRSSYMKTYDAYGKIKIVQQDENIPVTLSAVAAGSVPTIRNYFPDSQSSFFNKSSGSVQLLAAKTFGDVGIQLSPGILTTGYLLPENQSLSVFTLGLAGSVKLSQKVSANLEYLPQFNSALPGQSPLSLGVDVDTGGHLFQLILSNSQQFFTQSLYTATRGNWAEGSLYFGFNLIREFRIKYY